MREAGARYRRRRQLASNARPYGKASISHEHTDTDASSQSSSVVFQQSLSDDPSRSASRNVDRQTSPVLASAAPLLALEALAQNAGSSGSSPHDCPSKSIERSRDRMPKSERHSKLPRRKKASESLDSNDKPLKPKAPT